MSLPEEDEYDEITVTTFGDDTVRKIYRRRDDRTVGGDWDCSGLVAAVARDSVRRDRVEPEPPVDEALLTWQLLEEEPAPISLDRVGEPEE